MSDQVESGVGGCADRKCNRYSERCPFLYEKDLGLLPITRCLDHLTLASNPGLHVYIRSMVQCQICTFSTVTWNLSKKVDFIVLS